MKSFKVSFVIGEISDEEVEALKQRQAIISKMILTPDDYDLFYYETGDHIQVETENGNRLWCSIEHLEVIRDTERVILIFTLLKSETL